MQEPGFGQFGRVLVFVGVAIAALGLLMLAADKFGLGRLPGDISWKGKNTTVHFPIASSILISLVLTVLLNLFLSRR
ncbi:MAG TPA: DUF2905 domain-containing protein [Polyangiaceae bacterium]|jgi:hypothetical protein|nr:DUF2905 domain-containing protein [Polyangiaceae bacterium]